MQPNQQVVYGHPQQQQPQPGQVVYGQPATTVVYSETPQQQASRHLTSGFRGIVNGVNKFLQPQAQFKVVQQPQPQYYQQPVHYPQQVVYPHQQQAGQVPAGANPYPAAAGGYYQNASAPPVSQTSPYPPAGQPTSAPAPQQAAGYPQAGVPTQPPSHPTAQGYPQPAPQPSAPPAS